jgi:hypothetical protein
MIWRTIPPDPIALRSAAAMKALARLALAQVILNAILVTLLAGVVICEVLR